MMKQLEKMIILIHHENPADDIGASLPKENPTEAVGSDWADWAGGTVNETNLRD